MGGATQCRNYAGTSFMNDLYINLYNVITMLRIFHCVDLVSFLLCTDVITHNAFQLVAESGAVGFNPCFSYIKRE